jgi:hypothetical protein
MFGKLSPSLGSYCSSCAKGSKEEGEKSWMTIKGEVVVARGKPKFHFLWHFPNICTCHGSSHKVSPQRD